jgi:heme A synthase
MDRARRLPVPALAVFALACLWLLAGMYARQQQAHVACPDWPECYRVPTTPSAAGAVASWLPPAADGVMLLALAGLAALGWKKRGRGLDRRWGIPLLALALAASSAGTSLLYIGPGVALWQLLATLAVCASLWWLVLRDSRFLPPLPETGPTRALRPRVLVGLGLPLLATAAGGWAVAHGIGVPCPDFPSCRGEWWPAGSLLAVLTVADRPDETTAAALAVSHRLAALAALVYLAWLGLHLWRAGAPDHLCRYGMLVLGALLAAVGLGIMGAVTRLPPATAMAHSAAAAVLILSLVTVYHVLLPASRPERTDA